MKEQQDAKRGKMPPVHFFRELLLESNIICDVGSVSVQELFDIMLNRMKRTSPELDIEKARKALMEREELIPTMIAPGLAVPHARIEGIAKPYLALACSPSGIDFHSELGPGNVVVLFLSPLEDPTLHLQILASLASAFKQPDFAGALSAMRRPADVIGAFGDGALPDLIKAGNMKKWPANTLRESDTLKYAIELLFKSNVSMLIVLDENGVLRGALTPRDLLAYCLPEHLLWTEDLGPLVEFAQFTEVLEKASDTKVGDVMREEIVTADVNVPAVQLAKMFIMEKVSEIAITESGKFVGVVEINDFCSHLFWI